MLKKVFTPLFAAIITLSLFTSCSKDNNYAKDIKGEYACTVTVGEANAPATTTISAVNDKTVKMALSDFVFNTKKISLSIDKVAVDKATSGYTVAYSDSISLVLEGNAVKVFANLTGTVKDSALDCSINVDATKIGLSKIPVTVKGKLKK